MVLAAIAGGLMSAALIILPIALDILDTRHGMRPGKLTGKEGDDARYLVGSINHDVAEQVENWLRANPGRSLTLSLSSEGGYVKDMHEIATALDEHGRVDTMVADGKRCASACTIVWLSGRKRAIEPFGQLVFHSSRTGLSWIGWHDEEREDKWMLTVLAHREPTLAEKVAASGVMRGGRTDEATAYPVKCSVGKKEIRRCWGVMVSD